MPRTPHGSVGRVHEQFSFHGGRGVIASIITPTRRAGLYALAALSGALARKRGHFLSMARILMARVQLSIFLAVSLDVCPLDRLYRRVLAPSSRGLGHWPFTPATRVRIPSGSQIPSFSP